MSRLAQESRENLAARLRAGGKLLIGTPGDLLLEIWWQQVATLSDRLQKLLPQESSPQVTVDAMVDGIRLQAHLNNVTDKGLIHHSLSEPGPHDLLRFWFFHLALNVADNVRSRHSCVLTPVRTMAFKPVENALEILGDLVVLYREGMTRPLAFFPRSAWAYVEAASEPDNAAARVWRGSEYMMGEADNAYYALAFRETLDTELEGEFPVLANRVFGPLRANLTEVDMS
jgi:exodeoxyribonuclease V gamma subunit